MNECENCINYYDGTWDSVSDDSRLCDLEAAVERILAALARLEEKL